MAKKKKTKKGIASKLSVNLGAPKLRAVVESVTATLAKRIANLEASRGLEADGPIQVGRYGSQPIGFPETSTVRFVIKDDRIDARLERGEAIWLQAAGDSTKRRLEINLGNGIWFPAGGSLFVRVRKD